MLRGFREWWLDVIDDLSSIDPEEVLVSICVVFGLIFILFMTYQHKIKSQQAHSEITRTIKEHNQKVKTAEDRYISVMQTKPYVTIKQATQVYSQTVRVAGNDFKGCSILYTVVDNPDGQEYFFQKGRLIVKNSTMINKAWQRQHNK